LEADVPQGSLLSTTLFILKINNIIKTVLPNVEFFLYVDDFVICYSSHNMNAIERKLQQVFNKLQTWANTNGFKFSQDKTRVIHFCNQRKLHLDPVLFLNNQQLTVASANSVEHGRTVCDVGRWVKRRVATEKFDRHVRCNPMMGRRLFDTTADNIAYVFRVCHHHVVIDQRAC